MRMTVPQTGLGVGRYVVAADGDAVADALHGEGRWDGEHTCSLTW